MDWFDFFLIALATVNLSVNIANPYTAGPWSIFDKLRRTAGVTYNELNNIEAEPGSFADMLLCPYCNSVWIGALLTSVYALLVWLALPASWLFVPLAAGGVVVVIQELK